MGSWEREREREREERREGGRKREREREGAESLRIIEGRKYMYMYLLVIGNC